MSRQRRLSRRRRDGFRLATQPRIPLRLTSPLIRHTSFGHVRHGNYLITVSKGWQRRQLPQIRAGVPETAMPTQLAPRPRPASGFLAERKGGARPTRDVTTTSENADAKDFGALKRLTPPCPGNGF